MVEQLLPTPEMRGSNPNISKILSTNEWYIEIEKTNIKKNRLEMAHLEKMYTFNGKMIAQLQLNRSKLEKKVSRHRDLNPQP